MAQNQYIDERAAKYGDPSPETLLRQLNENWTKIRTFERTVADRDRVINTLNTALQDRDKLIDRLKKRLTFGRGAIALLYALAAGAAGAGAKELGALFVYWMHR